MRDIALVLLVVLVVAMAAFIYDREFGSGEVFGLVPTRDAAPVASTLGATNLQPVQVNNATIPAAELQLMLRDRGLDEATIDAQTLTELQNRLINRELYNQAARAAGLHKNAAIATRMRMAAEDVLASEYRAAFLRNNPVTDERVRATYDNLVLRAGDVEYRVSQIFVLDEQAALFAMAKLNEGNDNFADLAKRLSKDDASREQGGDLGWLSALIIQPDFLQAILALRPGDYSIPIQGANGWHILYLAETRPFALRSYDELAGDIRAGLEQAALDAHLQELKQE